ncbi:MAG: hypothetical protein U0790_12420 [Isosphaeraceae bacterium]
MSRFPGKKLPPHWLYVPSRREVRDLLRGLAADVRRVDFDGTGSGLRYGTLLLGYLERRAVGKAWCFYLRLWGVPEAAVEAQRDELATAAIQAIGQSIGECLAVPAEEVVKPTQLLLWFNVGADGVIPACKVKPVDRYSFSAGSWWASPSPA